MSARRAPSDGSGRNPCSAPCVPRLPWVVLPLLGNLLDFCASGESVLQILPAASVGSGLPIHQTASGESVSIDTILSAIAPHSPLPWSAYVQLLLVRNEAAREFYEAEAMVGGWTIRQLRRQIDTQFYERTALSRDKEAMLLHGRQPQAGDTNDPAGEFKDDFCNDDGLPELIQ